MKRIILSFAVALFAATLSAAETNRPSESPTDSEIAYRQVIEKRVADIIAPLNLTDADQSRKVHEILVAQYRTLRDWHDANDSKRKAAKAEELEQFRSSLKSIHESFLMKLSANLSPEQIEMIKDKMTYGKVQFTYDGYMNLYPNLSVSHQQKILALLKEAREEAMDGGSSEEKSAIFNRYKGKINNYLSAQGVSAPKKKPQNQEINPTNTPR